MNWCAVAAFRKNQFEYNHWVTLMFYSMCACLVLTPLLNIMFRALYYSALQYALIVIFIIFIQRRFSNPHRRYIYLRLNDNVAGPVRAVCVMCNCNQAVIKQIKYIKSPKWKEHEGSHAWRIRWTVTPDQTPIFKQKYLTPFSFLEAIHHIQVTIFNARWH